MLVVHVAFAATGTVAIVPSSSVDRTLSEGDQRAS
jgi:hypothetical protein